MEIEKNYTRSGFKMLTENMDPKTGIHYGVISERSTSMERMDHWYDHDACYEESEQEFTQKLNEFFDLIGYIPEKQKNDLEDELTQLWNDNCEIQDPEWYYNDEGYSAQYSPSLVCWIITTSPYYAYVKSLCSPCVMNAGDLDSGPAQKKSGYKTYCLPKEFFEDDKAPYTYYEVATDKKVYL